MSETDLHISVEKRIIIKFLAKEGVNPTEILRRLQAQFGDNTLSRTRVFAWHKEFSGGRETVENESHARRPRTSVTEANIDAIGNLIEGNRHITLWEIVAKLNISYGNVHRIVTDDLKMRKVSARWVPRLLSADHKRQQLEISQRHIEQFQQDGDAFLNRIVTCDKT